jgi:hypothetical protein
MLVPRRVRTANYFVAKSRKLLSCFGYRREPAKTGTRLCPLSAVERVYSQQRKLYLRSTRDEIRRWSASRVAD